VAESGDAAVRADAAAGAALAEAAARAAANLVAINLAATADDPRVAQGRQFATAAAEAAERALAAHD
jgi:formiminotetrahydrofolate cyclodeaminase